MAKVVCTDCDRKRDPHRPIAKLLDGSVTFTCRQCWKALYFYVQDNGEDPPSLHCYMWDEMSEADQVALRHASR